MNAAILIVSSASLVCSAGTLVIMVGVARELKSTKSQVDREINSLKTKVNNNAKVIKTAFASLVL